MTTRRLYYYDAFQDNFTAQVLSCKPLADPLAGHDATCWGVLLDQTHLYPTSGGQPNDLGVINDIPLIDCIEEEDTESVIHVVQEKIAREHLPIRNEEPS